MLLFRPVGYFLKWFIYMPRGSFQFPDFMITVRIHISWKEFNWWTLLHVIFLLQEGFLNFFMSVRRTYDANIPWGVMLPYALRGWSYFTGFEARPHIIPVSLFYHFTLEILSHEACYLPCELRLLPSEMCGLFCEVCCPAYFSLDLRHVPF